MKDDMKTCPYVKDDHERLLCKAAKSFLMQTKGAKTSLCTSEQYTFCHIYKIYNDLQGEEH